MRWRSCPKTLTVMEDDQLANLRCDRAEGHEGSHTGTTRRAWDTNEYTWRRGR